MLVQLKTAVMAPNLESDPTGMLSWVWSKRASVMASQEGKARRREAGRRERRKDSGRGVRPNRLNYSVLVPRG
jgi:hypothetical protein